MKGAVLEDRGSPTRDRARALLVAATASATLMALIYLGSRRLEHYDAALFGYTVAGVIAFGVIIFRYVIWLHRPATRRYWLRGWQLFLDRKELRRSLQSIIGTAFGNLVAQRFILRRSRTRWLMHALIMWGCIISAAITFPLVFGWIHFELEGARSYRAYLFGFSTIAVDGRSTVGWMTFHALDFTAIMVIAGCAIAIHRRLHDRGAVSMQQFALDFAPHLLLIAISVSGLMLTASSLWLGGYMYSFISLTHQALVIMTLFYLPFGKFFHIVQRPASIGIELYQNRGGEMLQARCARCGTEFVSQAWLDDLEDVVRRLGFDYRLKNGHALQDYCPRCKRILRGLAYAALVQRSDRR
ncbi:MAG: MFS transporter [Pyrinomonas sp.]|uniref:MFS transporter n=1 Tax=Pyrinomonas sp. TaxID=2080306 RepID=UPI00332A20F6